MPTTKPYVLPDLPYDYDALAPWCPAETLQLHHLKHHAAYVDGANDAAGHLAELDPDDTASLTAWQSTFAFNLAGHVMHSLFWTSLTPEPGLPSPTMKSRLVDDFGSLVRFRDMLTAACMSVQGSGWGALTSDPMTGHLRVRSILNHNDGGVPTAQLLAVVDVWEHAYYLTHRNDRAAWATAAIEHLDWRAIESRL